MWVGRQRIAEHPASQRHTEKRLLDALSWLSETWKISIAVKNETAVDALWICIFLRQRARERWLLVFCIFCVRLLRCPVYCNRQFQGLGKRDGHQVQFSRFFLFYTSPYESCGGASRWPAIDIQIYYGKEISH